MAELPLEVTPAQVKARIDSGERLHLIDVREPAEAALARIDGAELIPMGSVPAALQAIEARSDEFDIAVYCHHGIRSLHVVNWLRQQGVARVQSVAGGIERWSVEVDPAVPRY